MYEYKAKVINIVDGDTFDAIVQLGFGVNMSTRFRVAGVDTPEIRTKDLIEKAHGKAATERATELLLGKEVIIRTGKTGKYGRYIADVTLPDGYNFSSVMIAEGYEKHEVYEAKKGEVFSKSVRERIDIQRRG